MKSLRKDGTISNLYLLNKPPKKEFGKWKLAVAAAAAVPIAVTSWFAYKYMDANYPIWEAGIYKVDKNAVAQPAWEKSGTERLQSYLKYLPLIVNTNNKELMEKLAGVKIVLHTTDRYEGIAANYEKDGDTYHIYPSSNNSAVLHETLHLIYAKGMSPEDKAKFNAFAGRVYELATVSEQARRDRLGNRYTDKVKAYLDTAKKVVERVDISRYGGEEYVAKVFDEMFAAIATVGYGLPAPMLPIYEKYINVDAMPQLLSQVPNGLF